MDPVSLLWIRKSELEKLLDRTLHELKSLDSYRENITNLDDVRSELPIHGPKELLKAYGKHLEALQALFDSIRQRGSLATIGFLVGLPGIPRKINEVDNARPLARFATVVKVHDHCVISQFIENTRKKTQRCTKKIGLPHAEPSKKLLMEANLLRILELCEET